jgi:hypothetical protein
MQQLIGSISHSVPTVLGEVITVGRTLKRRAVDVLATSTGPAPPTGRPRRSTAASNISAAQPSASANLTNYIARSLLETGGFRPRPHPRS